MNPGGMNPHHRSSAMNARQIATMQEYCIYMKEIADEMVKNIEFLDKNLEFLRGLGAAFSEQIHTDIQLIPADNGPPLHAHKALLAVRSEIFKQMLDSEDGYKAPASETFKLQEMNHEELESLLVFLYTGRLPPDKMEKHVHALFLAAHKYEIQFLQYSCEHHMLRRLDPSNALDVLEISDACGSKTLKDAALNFIVKNMDKIAFSSEYESFGPKNPNLCVQITRAFLSDAKKQKRI